MLKNLLIASLALFFIFSCATKEQLAQSKNRDKAAIEDPQIAAADEPVEEVIEEREQVKNVVLPGYLIWRKNPVSPMLFLSTLKGQKHLLKGNYLEELEKLGGSKIVVAIDCQINQKKECLIFNYQLIKGPAGRRPLVGVIVEEGEDLYLETKIAIIGKAKKIMQQRGGEKLYLEPVWSNNRIVNVKNFGLLKGEDSN